MQIRGRTPCSRRTWLAPASNLRVGPHKLVPTLLYQRLLQSSAFCLLLLQLLLTLFQLLFKGGSAITQTRQTGGGGAPLPRLMLSVGIQAKVALGATALRVEDAQLRLVTGFNGRVRVYVREAKRENASERTRARSRALSICLRERGMGRKMGDKESERERERGSEGRERQ